MNQQEHDEMKMMMGEDKEIWAKIEGYEGYEISTYGRVRSFWKRTSQGKGRGTTHILCPDSIFIRPLLDGNMRFYCNFKRSQRRKHIHHIVAETFIPNPNNFSIIDHIDGNPLNNRITNLRWSTITQNNINSRLRCDNTSGFKGITRNHHGWSAEYTIDGKRKRKWFKDKNDAIEYRKKMVEQHYDLDFYKDG